MLIPVGQSDGLVQRWPWVTIGIVVLNVLSLVVLWEPQARAEREVRAAAEEAAQYYAKHPHLELRPPLDVVLKGLVPKGRELGVARELAEERTDAQKEEERAIRAIEQRQLDSLGERLAEARGAMPWRTLGYVPAENNVLGLLTSQYVHAGILHLLFNMWFLWLVGCNVEDAWGRIVFPLFYTSAGIFAGLAHKLGAWHSVVPVVGASGAVAGAMGAFPVRHARARIRFFYFYWRWGFFNAPAYLMLPLWLAGELMDALLVPVQHGGVASWAHVGGFAYRRPLRARAAAHRVRKEDRGRNRGDRRVAAGSRGCSPPPI